MAQIESGGCAPLPQPRYARGVDKIAKINLVFRLEADLKQHIIQASSHRCTSVASEVPHKNYSTNKRTKDIL